MEKKSHFGINLLTLFFGNLFFLIFNGFFLLSGHNSLFGNLLNFSVIILCTIFIFGLIYGFFRFFDLKSDLLENFYQNFPIPYKNRESNQTQKTKKLDQKSNKKYNPNEYYTDETEETINIDWNDIFSFKFLRIIGIVLVIVALFSLLFQIEWKLIHKIFFTFGLSILSGITAEYFFRKEKTNFSGLAIFISFLAAEFGITLLFKKYLNASPLGISPEVFWLYAKLIVTFAYFPTVFRYTSKFYQNAFFIVPILSPITLLITGANFTIPIIAPFLFILNILGSFYAKEIKSNFLHFWNLITLNIFFLYFGKDTISTNFSIGTFELLSAELTLLVFCVSFLLNLFRTAKYTLEKSLDPVSLNWLLVLNFGFILFAGYIFAEYIPWLESFYGLAYVIVSICGFATYIFLESKKVENHYTEILFNLSIWTSAIGLFFHINTSWGLLALLVYSTLVIWYGIATDYLRTRVYGFIFLIVTLIQLFTEYSYIFNQLSGTVIILIVGGFLIFLSYKFEALKSLISDITDKKKK